MRTILAAASTRSAIPSAVSRAEIANTNLKVLVLRLRSEQVLNFVCIIQRPIFSLDHPVRPCQHVRRDRKPDLLRGLQIDHELELGRLLDGETGRLRAF